MLLGKTLLIATVCLAAPALAEPASPQPPTTQPASDIDSLIRQLGDDSFQVRQQAVRRLREIGKPALPALKQAQNSDDAEVHLRAQELVRELERPPIPRDLPQPLIAGNGGFYPYSRHSEKRGEVLIVDINEGGRSIHIEKYPASIRMIVTGQIDGEPATREYKAANADELRRGNPEAYALFEASTRPQQSARMDGFPNNRVRLQGGVIQVIPPVGPQIMPIIPPPQLVLPVPQNEDLDRLERRLLDQMQQSNIPGADQDRVMGLLRQLREVRPPMEDPRDMNKQMQEYNARSDALRKELQHLKLPDPGDALPPPGSARLGISAIDESDNGEGITVKHVLPGSRAEKLGLREGDVIEKVNGAPLHSTHELRQLVTNHPNALVIEGQRDGKHIKFQEATN